MLLYKSAAPPRIRKVRELCAGEARDHGQKGQVQPLQTYPKQHQYQDKALDGAHIQDQHASFMILARRNRRTDDAAAQQEGDDHADQSAIEGRQRLPPSPGHKKGRRDQGARPQLQRNDFAGSGNNFVWGCIQIQPSRPLSSLWAL